MKPISDDEFELSTGKKVYAHRLMLSIGRDEQGFSFGYGEDGGLYLEDHNYHDDADYFTHKERVEIARYALEMWQEYLSRLQKRGESGDG